MEQKAIIKENENKFSWHNYNLSQTKEKALFVNILGDLCNLIVEARNAKGRKPRPLKDIAFAVVMKEYLNTSSRRVQSDLKFFAEAGFIESEIPFNTLLDHLEKRNLRDVLKELIEISAMPLKQIEVDFAIDATGFGTPRYETFFHYKYGKDVKWKAYRKCHAVCGIKTNIITAIDITKGQVHDNTRFESLAKDTARNFTIRDFCGDKGYLSGKNFSIINEFGGQAFIPFKSNTSGSSHSKSGYRSYFKSAFKFFKEHKKEYLEHYHKRSNIESAFSMIKRKFGTNIKCKKETSQDNEILSKILAHNICVLVQELFLNKIELNFNKCLSSYIGN